MEASTMNPKLNSVTFKESFISGFVDSIPMEFN